MNAQWDVVLDELLRKNSIQLDDLKLFLHNLVVLINQLKMKNLFATFDPTVKKWIAAFEEIVNGDKTVEATKNFFKKQCCKVTTKIFLNLKQSYSENQSEYIKELMYYWKSVTFKMCGLKRATNFLHFIPEFKSLIEDLRTAKSRYEQTAIMAVLVIYIENVSSDELLSKLKERSNSHVVVHLANLIKNPTAMDIHNFLYEMNALGRNIITVKATTIICSEMTLNKSDYDLWFDFNMTDNSVTMLAISLSEQRIFCSATATNPVFYEEVLTEHEIKIQGSWSILRRIGDNSMKRTTITVFLPINDRNAIWKAKVKSIFSLVTKKPSCLNESTFEGNTSRIAGEEMAQLLLCGGGNETSSQKAEMNTSLSTTCFEDDLSYSNLAKQRELQSITPVAPQQSDGDGMKTSSESISDNSSGASFRNDFSVEYCTDSESKYSNECDESFGDQSSFSSEDSFAGFNEDIVKFIANTDGCTEFTQKIKLKKVVVESFVTSELPSYSYARSNGLPQVRFSSSQNFSSKYKNDGNSDSEDLGQTTDNSQSYTHEDKPDERKEQTVRGTFKRKGNGSTSSNVKRPTMEPPKSGTCKDEKFKEKLNLLKHFVQNPEACPCHRKIAEQSLLHLQAMDDLENGKQPNMEELLATTVAAVKMICQQQRDHAANV